MQKNGVKKKKRRREAQTAEDKAVKKRGIKTGLQKEDSRLQDKVQTTKN